MENGVERSEPLVKSLDVVLRLADPLLYLLELPPHFIPRPTRLIFGFCEQRVLPELRIPTFFISKAVKRTLSRSFPKNQVYLPRNFYWELRAVRRLSPEQTGLIFNNTVIHGLADSLEFGLDLGGVAAHALSLESLDLGEDLLGVLAKAVGEHLVDLVKIPVVVFQLHFLNLGLMLDLLVESLVHVRLVPLGRRFQGGQGVLWILSHRSYVLRIHRFTHSPCFPDFRSLYEVLRGRNHNRLLLFLDLPLSQGFLLGCRLTGLERDPDCL